MTESANTLGIGFVGLGGICRQRHVPGLQQQEGVRFVAVANQTERSTKLASNEFDIPHPCEDWKEVVNHPEVDAVVIGTWPYMHKEVTLAALEAGKHVFCQARMAMDAEEAEAMYAAAKQAGKVAVLCPVPFGLSVDRTVARLVKEGRVGKVRLVRVQGFSADFVEPEAPVTWRKDHRLSGLNMGTLGMYIEVVHRWFGWTKSVQADTAIFVPERRDREGRPVHVEIPDQVLFNARLESDVQCQYVISTGVRHGKDLIEIYGDRGVLRYDVAADALYESWAAGEQSLVTIKEEDAYDVANWSVEADFLRAVREGAEYHPDFKDGLMYMRVIQAVYDSAKSGARVEVSLEH